MIYRACAFAGRGPRPSGKHDSRLPRETRDLLGASQGVFAGFLGVSVQTIRAWEQGRQNPSEMVCRFLGEIKRNPQYWRIRLRDSLVIKRVGDKGR